MNYKGYYKRQIERLGKPDEYGVSFSLSSSNGRTNNLQLNDVSLKELIKYVKKHKIKE